MTLLTLLAIAGVAGLMAFASWAIPESVIRVLFPEASLGGAPSLIPYTMAVFLQMRVAVHVTYHLPRGEHGFVAALVPGLFYK